MANTRFAVLGKFEAAKWIRGIGVAMSSDATKKRFYLGGGFLKRSAFLPEGAECPSEVLMLMKLHVCRWERTTTENARGTNAWCQRSESGKAGLIPGKRKIGAVNI